MPFFTLSEKVKNGQATFIAPLQPSTLASFPPWGSSKGADRKRLARHKGNKTTHFSIVPKWLRILNIAILFPILIWPLLFFNAGALLDSSLDYKWIYFFLMLSYPAILIGNIYLSKKLFESGYKKLAIIISLTLGVCGIWFFNSIFY